MEQPAPPTCFISYSHDDQAHKNWVRHLAEQLQQNGVLTSLDQWHLHPGHDLTAFMESRIRTSYGLFDLVVHSRKSSRT